VTLPGDRVSIIVAAAEERFGAEFARILAVSNIWLNGDPVGPDAQVRDEDELAVIPPVSGG
jgi:molybdopterin converting factor small subunit